MSILLFKTHGGVREDINPKDITFADAYTFLPLGIRFIPTISADIKQVLEDALDFALTKSTAFPYGAGIRYEANEFPEKRETSCECRGAK